MPRAFALARRARCEDGKVVIPINWLIRRGDFLVVCYHKQGKKLVPMFRVQFHTCAMKHWSFTLTKAQLDDTKDKDERFPPACTVTFNFDPKQTPPDDSEDNFGAGLAHTYSTVNRNVTESAGAFFDNVRHTPVTLSKDDKKGRKKAPASMASHDFRASDMKMTDNQRLAVMMLVKDGKITIDEAMAEVMQAEGIGNAAQGAGADTPVQQSQSPPKRPPPTSQATPTPPPPPKPAAPIAKTHQLASTDGQAKMRKKKPARPRPPSVADLEAIGIRRPSMEVSSSLTAGNPFALELAAEEDSAPVAPSASETSNPFNTPQSSLPSSPANPETPNPFGANANANPFSTPEDANASNPFADTAPSPPPNPFDSPPTVAPPAQSVNDFE